MKLGRIHTRGALIASSAVLALPIAVQAAHWPTFGGDAGHSGNQPVEATKMPTAFVYSQPDSGAQTSIITSAGAAADQVLAYGIQNGATSNIRVRKLADGSAVGTPGDIDGDYDGNPLSSDADPDLFGPAPQHNVTPVETSSAAG